MRSRTATASALILTITTVAYAGDPTVNWSNLFRQSSAFLAIQHGFRLATEAGTREGLRGGFFSGYVDSVRNLHGWADGDPFYVNYIGHPMQGSTSAFIWTLNDLRYRDVTFGKDRRYWKSRLRAAAWAWAYSEQFEIGPFSEASIGKIQASFPQQGFGDHVVTPFFGLGWMVGEDILDRYVVRAIERRTLNPWIRILARTWLNPTRTFAQALGGERPWYRETRGSIFAPDSYVDRKSSIDVPTVVEGEDPLVAPFEFEMSGQASQELDGSGTRCYGGEGAAAIRLSTRWQLIGRLGGCNLDRLEHNVSGDSLHYRIGPKWNAAAGRRLRTHLQFLVGGEKVTIERFLPEEWTKVQGLRHTMPTQEIRRYYVRREEANAFSLSAGGGIDVRFNRALALRLASLEYNRSWLPPLNGVRFNGGLQFSSGLVVRMGTW